MRYREHIQTAMEHAPCLEGFGASPGSTYNYLREEADDARVNLEITEPPAHIVFAHRFTPSELHDLYADASLANGWEIVEVPRRVDPGPGNIATYEIDDVVKHEFDHAEMAEQVGADELQCGVVFARKPIEPGGEPIMHYGAFVALGGEFEKRALGAIAANAEVPSRGDLYTLHSLGYDLPDIAGVIQQRNQEYGASEAWPLPRAAQ
ncbi:MAG TPA: hypothetical protein VHT70_05675 [Candidatus Saccharimonadales bacterium]|jgi:hypothetical protein|nr:hypothetical protein [Candidatus Saccharimonadales bacterium]